MVEDWKVFGEVKTRFDEMRLFARLLFGPISYVSKYSKSIIVKIEKKI